MPVRTQKGPTGDRLRRCFISAPFGVDVSAVLDVLNERGIRARRLDSLRAGRSITSVIKSELHRSDFVCVILPRSADSASTLFELGVAVGLGKPTMVLAEQDVAIPVDLSDWPFGRISLDKPDTVRVAVNSLMQNLQRKARAATERAFQPEVAAASYASPPPRLERVPEQAFDREQAFSELGEIKMLSPADRAHKFQRFVSSLFEKAGIPVALESGHSDRGIDLAFWLDEVSRVIVNPIFVEVKTRLSANSWKESSDQLFHYLTAMRGQCGLLITLELPPSDTPRFTPTLPLIVTLTAEELVSLLWSRQLGRELIRIRNRAVHG
jgi:Restriction endonuclease